MSEYGGTSKRRKPGTPLGAEQPPVADSDVSGRARLARIAGDESGDTPPSRAAWLGQDPEFIAKFEAEMEAMFGRMRRSGG